MFSFGFVERWMRRGEQVVYFALQPPPEVVQRSAALVAEMATRFNLTGRPTPAGRLHISLAPIGAFERAPRQVVETARRAASRVRVRPFRLVFNLMGTWGRGEGQRPVVLYGDEGVIGAETLHAAIHDALATPGMARRVAPEIRPHMTLLRDVVEMTPRDIEPIDWWVRDFVLIRSFHGQGRHELLGRWPLKPGSTGSINLN